MHYERKGLPWLAALQVTVLIAWIVSFLWLARDNGDAPLLGRFIRSDYWWLVYAATGILIALVASMVVHQPHQHQQNRLRSLIQIIILALPLFCLPLATSSELSIGAAEKRSLYTPRTVAARPQSPKRAELRQDQKIAAVPLKPVTNSVKRGEPTILDLVSGTDDFEGSSTTLVGIVHRDKRLPANSFFCYRLVMVCCAADAAPAGVIVQWPGTRKLKKGTWVKVHGKVTSTTFEEGDYPAISAESVEKTKPPKNPFLIPR